jgi:hypothetical protein
MPLLDLQRRFRELGRIRLGVQTKTANGKMRPSKLSTFRLTSPSQPLIEAAASLYGGDARPWDNNGKQEHEVITNVDVLDIIVPPGSVLSQHWEMWSGGGCQRRCDGVRDLLSESPCLCPADYGERRELAARGLACKPTSRLNVLLRDLPDIGVWRVESHGFNAAVELAGTAELLEIATRSGVMIPARLRLDPREKKVPGKPTNKFAVPVIEIAATYIQVAEALGVSPGPLSLQSGQSATAALPVQVGSDPSRPALPAASPAPARAPLPASPRGRQSTKAPLPADRPALPSDPSFKIEVQLDEPEPKPALSVVPAPPPDDPFDAVDPSKTESKPALGALKRESGRGQQIAMSAKRNDIDDLSKHALIEWVTEGRTSSGSDVTDEEASRLHALFAELKRGRKTMTLDEDGKVVGVQ